MRILVTGATGFVGRYLCKLHMSKRRELWGTYLQSDPDQDLHGVRLLYCDVTKFNSVQRVVREVRPTHLYHLAALSSVRDSYTDAKSVFDANFLGTLNLLEAVRGICPLARVLLVGSAHIYGKVSKADLPITETQALNPNSPYGVSKAAADLLGSQFFQSYGLQIIRARPFNHTGPGQSTHFVCSDFAKQFAAIDLGLSKPVVRVGDVHTSRDFSDVRDVVRAYELLLRKGKPGEAYNVGSGQAFPLQTILEILQTFTSTQVHIKVEEKRVRKGESDIIFGSNQKLKKATVWAPKFQFRTTLQHLFTHWKNILGSQRG